MKKEELIKLGFTERLLHRFNKTQHTILSYPIYISDHKECYLEFDSRSHFNVPSLRISEDDWDEPNAHVTHLFIKECNTIKKLKKRIEILEDLFGNLEKSI